MKRMEINDSPDAGYTFVETIAVLAISALLTAGVFVSAVMIVEKAREVHTKQQISMYKSALNSYYYDCGVFPSVQQGLEALWDKPVLNPVPKGWNGPYVDGQIQRDSWNNSFVYLTEKSSQFPLEVKGKLPYVIISYGADGMKGGDGKNEDIVSWK